ncbi:MAG TPA: hypothetical protein VMY77_10350 [Chitinophagaceae bacterium]|nr:hypothetical protein [Chitinophagaceae bacterium]
MIRARIYFLVLIVASCSSSKTIYAPVRNSSAVTGAEFYKQAATFNWQRRDSFAVKEILEGNMPSFFKRFVAVHTQITDSIGKKINATYYVSPDYLSIGSDDDWARLDITPMAAQQIADSFHCFLPTRQIADDIYKAAKIKLEPVPMYAFRDSTVTMYHHHLIIEGQRKLRRGLIAGIKKDVVITGKITRDPKQNRVAIYGWHKPDGRPIQPLYTGHVNWYVDYSHGIRLIYRTIYVDGKAMDYTDVLKDKTLKKILCDEEDCDFYHYPY